MVSVPISCAAGGASCTVTVTLTAVKTVSKANGKTVKKTVVLGTSTTTVAAGTKATPAVKLNKAGKALVAKDKKLATKVLVTSKASGGATMTATKKVVLSASKPRAKAHD